MHFRAKMSHSGQLPSPPKPRRPRNGSGENGKKPRRGLRKGSGLESTLGRRKSWPKWPKCRPSFLRQPQHRLPPELRRHLLLLLLQFARTRPGRPPTIGSPTTTGWSPSSCWPSRSSSTVVSDLDNLWWKWKIRFHEKLLPLWCVLVLFSFLVSLARSTSVEKIQIFCLFSFRFFLFRKFLTNTKIFL